MPRSPVQKLAPFVRLLSNSDYIEIPYTASLSPGNGSFVLAIWYRPNDTTASQTSTTHVVLQTASVTYTNGILDVSVYTVETHRTHLMQKLNLHNTAEIVLYAVRKKIIS